jgi:hypothetical protein
MKRAKAIIEHPNLDPFEPQLKSLLEWGFDGEIRALEAAGCKLGNDLVDEKAHEIFNEGLFSLSNKLSQRLGSFTSCLKRNVENLQKRSNDCGSDRSPCLQDAQESSKCLEIANLS